jgi:hypothetical protein
MKANVYVDGFNLYYSALRRRFQDCKWLDVRALAETLFPNDEIGRVLYFSARVISRPDDPQEATRQQMYFRAAWRALTLGSTSRCSAPATVPHEAFAAPSMSSRSSATARCKQASSPTCSATAAGRFTAPGCGDPLKR